MLYKNIKVEDVNVIVFLREKSKDDWKHNEITVLKWLHDNNINASVENPIDDLVFIYLDEKMDIELLTDVYKKAEKEFAEVKINLHLEHFTEEGHNSIDLNLKEFQQLSLETN